MVLCRVLLLDGSDYEVQVDVSGLLNKIIDHIKRTIIMLYFGTIILLCLDFSTGLLYNECELNLNQLYYKYIRTWSTIQCVERGGDSEACNLNYIIHSFVRSTISIAPLQVHYYSEVLLTQHGYCAGILRQSATGNCEWRTCPRSLHGWRLERESNQWPFGQRRRLYQCATHAPQWSI